MLSPTRSLHLSVIQKLASNDSSCYSVADLLRTEEQRLLQISPIHICLAGLALLENDCTDDVQQKQQRDELQQRLHHTFHEYCRYYNEHNTKGTPVSLLAALSPRVMPNMEQLTAIRRHVSRFAEEALEELLLEEKLSNDTRKKNVHDFLATSHKVKRKKVKVRQETKSRTSGPPPSMYPDDLSHEGFSLVELVHRKLRVAQANDDKSVITEDEWLPIPPKLSIKRRRPVVNGAKVQAVVRGERNYEANEALESLNDHGAYLDNPVLHESQSAAKNKNRPLIVDASIKTPATTSLGTRNPAPHPRLNQDQDSSATTSDCSLISDEYEAPVSVSDIIPNQTNDDRIVELEQALKHTKDLLQQERSRHAQQLNQEKEQHANSMQALQLRLYISETRVKTYQDALETHFQSVASNAWQLNSPPRPSALTSSDTPQLTSPLISRVIQNNQRGTE